MPKRKSVLAEPNLRRSVPAADLGGMGAVRVAGRRGFHRTPARPGRGRPRRLRGAGPRPGTSIWPSCGALYGFRSFSRAARELADRLREEAEQAQSNEDLVRSSSRPADAPEPSCRRRPRSSGSVPTHWSTRSAGSTLASPSGSARVSARPRTSARRDGRRPRDAVRLAQAVRAGQQFRRRQPAAGPPRAPPAPSMFRKASSTRSRRGPLKRRPVSRVF